MHPTDSWEALAWGEIADAQKSAELFAHLKDCRQCAAVFLALPPVPFYFCGRPFPAEMRPMPLEAVERTMKLWRILLRQGPMTVEGFAEDEALFHAVLEGLGAEGFAVSCQWNGKARDPVNGSPRLLGEGRWEALRAILDDERQDPRARVIAKIGSGHDVDETEVAVFENPRSVLAPIRGSVGWTVPGRWCFQFLFREWAAKNMYRNACISGGTNV